MQQPRFSETEKAFLATLLAWFAGLLCAIMCSYVSGQVCFFFGATSLACGTLALLGVGMLLVENFGSHDD
jgi:hypothetical protein